MKDKKYLKATKVYLSILIVSIIEIVMEKEELRKARLAAREVLARRGKLEFKPVSSAKWVDIKRSWTGILRVRIEHDTVHGCTPEMIRWWFENLGKLTTWDGIGFDGPPVLHYHLWHHRDHIAVRPLDESDNGFAVGKYTQLSEQFNDFHETISSKVVTDRLDESEFNFSIKQLGITVCRVLHSYSPEKDGSQFYAETVVGSSIPVIGWFLNWFIFPLIFSSSTGENWIRHNIEETGRSESIIPPLYEHYIKNRNKKLE